MATTRIKDLSKTATTVASDANIVIDGSSNGTQKITRDNFRQDTADAFVAAPSTYKLAPLNGVNKIDGTYLPTSGDTPKGEWNASTNSPTLADGTGTAGDYYDVTTAGTANLGSGAITYTVGDVVKYNGATWFKIDSVANILDGISTVDPAKVALQIPNVGTAANEVPVNGMLGDLAFQSSAGVVVDDLTVDGELIAAVGKPMSVNGPTMRFDGVDDHVSFAAPVGSAFSFTNSTDDTPFTVTGWVKMEADAFDYGIVSKYGSSTSTQEWTIYTSSSGKLVFTLKDGGGDYVGFETSDAMTEYIGQYIYLTVTYAGAGPNSGNAFGSAFEGMSFFINGKPTSIVELSSGTYSGMSSTAQAVTIGRSYSATFSYKGEIRDVKLFNKELSAAEVKEVYSNGQLPESFAESTGAITYVSDFSAGDDGWNNVLNGTQLGNVDGIGGRNDNLSFTLSGGNTTHRLRALNAAGLELDLGKRYRITFDYYIPSANAALDGIKMLSGTGSGITNSPSLTGTYDSWVHVLYDEIWTSSTDHPSFYATEAGSTTVNGDGDVFYLRNFRVTQIGSVLDARAENYNQSAGKLLDVSGNDFVGTQSGGVTLLAPRSHLSAGTLDLTNLPTSVTGLSAGEVYNDSGTLKIV